MSDGLGVLESVGPPWWYSVSGSGGEVDAMHADLQHPGRLVRSLRGSVMRTLDAVFDEIGTALEFPAYFGRNWDALDECLTDLSWLPAAAYVLVIRDSIDVLAQEPPFQFETFLKVLDRTASEWAERVDVGEPWDRSAVPFHIVFHEAQGRATLLHKRFGQLGFVLESLSWSPRSGN